MATKRFFKTTVEDQRTLNAFTSIGIISIDMVAWGSAPGSIVMPDGWTLVRDGASNLYTIKREGR